MTTTNTRLNRGARTGLLLGLLAVSLVSGHAARADDGDLRRQIVGSWGEDASCSPGRFTFRDDGTATLAVGRASGPTLTELRYTIRDGAVTILDPTGKEGPHTTPIQITGNEMTGVSPSGRPEKVVRCSDAASQAR